MSQGLGTELGTGLGESLGHGTGLGTALGRSPGLGTELDKAARLGTEVGTGLGGPILLGDIERRKQKRLLPRLCSVTSFRCRSRNRRSYTCLQ